MKKIALISVSDKEGLEGLVRTLLSWNYRIISSGGTAKTVRSLGYEVTEISDYTNYPESPDGLVKTLHPKIHGGLLMDPDNLAHNEYMKEQGIEPITFVAVNLYPFEKVILHKNIQFEEAVENIDIGGPAIIRAAAKGALLHGTPAVLVDSNQYSAIIEELNKTGGKLTFETTRALAVKAFERITEYDAIISSFLMKVSR